ncbi:Anti-sigma regulatory factor (Ser/Thr protein kinase) [Actinomadura meyerae]|jgi:anti-sigma regulatory factor (Ser/Thr protein kinase)|uniref:Anti-sigma regulatory factor (Ser/Thr protein kinase) n=1 Tax=Actinomadura meyerae TaxID=240840 RepID=A0A239P6R6_9ACTN|nr:ATP-binding protein [Actinomadura meyerae]SNT62374.1 Anti-sigma regulatory factor (Ser/Thr protein kinase) [Actinomadura meyerae]
MLLAVSVPAKPETSMYWRRDFHGKADQIRLVRAFAAHLLPDFPSLDDVLLVLDELSVNAVRHTRSGRDGGRFTVEISMDVAGVIVYVTDQGGPGQPRLRDITDLAEGGRGLLTVEALTATWSWTGDAQGRTVRATFPRER